MASKNATAIPTLEPPGASAGAAPVKDEAVDELVRVPVEPPPEVPVAQAPEPDDPPTPLGPVGRVPEPDGPPAPLEPDPEADEVLEAPPEPEEPDAPLVEPPKPPEVVAVELEPPLAEAEPEDPDDADRVVLAPPPVVAVDPDLDPPDEGPEEADPPLAVSAEQAASVQPVTVVCVVACVVVVLATVLSPNAVPVLVPPPPDVLELSATFWQYLSHCPNIGLTVLSEVPSLVERLELMHDWQKPSVFRKAEPSAQRAGVLPVDSASRAQLLHSS